MQNTYQRHFLWIVLCLGFCASMADAQNHVLSLDGDGDYMTSPAPPQLSGDTSFTVSFWMKYTPMPNRMWIMDIGKRGALTNVHWLINPDGSMQFGFWEGTQNQFGTSFGSFLRGKWVFVSTIYDSNSKSLKTYLNGILVAIDQVDGTPNLLTDQVQIGLKSGNESDFNGQLDEVQIWNIARTPEEIAATMHTPPSYPSRMRGGRGG